MTDRIDAGDEGARLAVAIDAFASARGVGAAGSDDAEWRALLTAMQEVRSARYAVLGRPALVTEARLDELVREARGLRATAEATGSHPGQAGQRYAPPGPVARALVLDRGWHALARRELGVELEPPYHAGYLYYDEQGAGIVPHVDDPEFAVNALLVLSRNVSASRGSATVLHPADAGPLRVVLEPGEAVLLEADGLVHARERMQPGEQVIVLSMGFSRVGGSAQSPTTA